MKTLGILIGAALGLIAWTAPGNVWAVGGFNATCQDVRSLLQSDRNDCRNKARKKTGAERQRHFKWCDYQWKNAVEFLNKCKSFSGQCYKGRVNWSFTFYDFIPSHVGDPTGVVAAFPGTEGTGHGRYNCPPAPRGFEPPNKAPEFVEPITPGWDETAGGSSHGRGMSPEMKQEMKQQCEKLRAMLAENPRDPQLKQVRQAYRLVCK